MEKASSFFAICGTPEFLEFLQEAKSDVEEVMQIDDSKRAAEISRERFFLMRKEVVFGGLRRVMSRMTAPDDSGTIGDGLVVIGPLDPDPEEKVLEHCAKFVKRRDCLCVHRLRIWSRRIIKGVKIVAFGFVAYEYSVAAAGNIVVQKRVAPIAELFGGQL
jgi:hypothetical protein